MYNWNAKVKKWNTLRTRQKRQLKMSIEDSDTGLMKEQLLCPRVWLLQHLVNLKISILTDKMSWFKNKTTTKKLRCGFFFCAEFYFLCFT